MALTDQGRNIEAIARYMGSQIPRTPAALEARDRWQAFYSSLSAYELNAEQATYDRARNLRLEFNRANAITAAEKAAVEEQALRGVTTEEIEGEGDRRTSTGEYVPAASPASALGRVALGAALGLGALLLLKVRWS